MREARGVSVTLPNRNLHFRRVTVRIESTTWTILLQIRHFRWYFLTKESRPNLRARAKGLGYLVNISPPNKHNEEKREDIDNEIKDDNPNIKIAFFKEHNIAVRALNRFLTARARSIKPVPIRESKGREWNKPSRLNETVVTECNIPRKVG